MESRFQGKETSAAKLGPVGGTTPITLAVEHWADVAFTKALKTSQPPAIWERSNLLYHACQGGPLRTPAFVPAFKRKQVKPVAPAA